LWMGCERGSCKRGKGTVLTVMWVRFGRCFQSCVCRGSNAPDAGGAGRGLHSF
jgi:hypothetical protein